MRLNSSDYLVFGGQQHFILIALIDAPYQAYQHNKQMKMSLKEVKDGEGH